MLSANAYMLRPYIAIFREINNNKGSEDQNVL